MRLKTYKMETFILLKLLTLEWDISRTVWRIEITDGSFFACFMLFHLSLTFFSNGKAFKISNVSIMRPFLKSF